MDDIPHPATLFADPASDPLDAAPLAKAGPQRDAAGGLIKPLPAFPSGDLNTWQQCADAYAWAIAIVSLRGVMTGVAIQNALSEAVRNDDLKLYRGWAAISLAYQDFVRTPNEGDAVN